MIKERRKIPRFLCSDQFSDSQLFIGSNEFSLISVNFNRFGIGLYSNYTLPLINLDDKGLISFQLETQQQKLIIEQLPCRIANIRLSDVGHQYGIYFPQIKTSDNNLSNSLLLIEKHLEDNNSPENRWGIF